METSSPFTDTGDETTQQDIINQQLVPYLVDTIKELTKRIEKLE